MSFTNTAGGYRILGDPITLSAGITADSGSGGSATATINTPLSLSSSQTWTIGSTGSYNDVTLANTATVNSPSANLTVAFPTGAHDDLVLLSDVESGTVAVSGGGKLHVDSSLNGTDGNAVNVSAGTELLAPSANATIGQLTATSAPVQVGAGAIPDGTLGVNGSASFDSASPLTMFIDQAGTMAGTDYSRLTASGSISLQGTLTLDRGTACDALHAGDVDTLVSAPGGFGGTTFTNVADGGVLPINGSCTPARSAVINYTPTSVTATVVGTSTSTSLTASSTSPKAGSSVTYTSTVSGTGGSGAPTGTVQFADNSSPISSCTAQPLTAGATTSTATCTVTYSSAGSHSITASYSGDDNFLASSSSPMTVSVVSSTSSPPPPPVTTGPATPATATTLAAKRVRTTRATLNGSLTTGGQTVTWQFQYGTRAHYNKATPIQTIAAGQTGSIPVSWGLRRLSPNTRYHYRLVVISRSSSSGAVEEATGNDLTFTTRATGKLLLLGGKLSVSGRTIRVPLKCDSNLGCDGRFSITTTAKVGKKHKLGTVLCTTKFVRIKRHGTAVVRARITRDCQLLLRHKRHQRMAAKFTARPRTGQLGLIKKITLRLT